MDTVKHFDLYRASLKKDALDGFDEYASIIPTAKPGEYPTVIDYLKHAFAHTNSAAVARNVDFYKIWVQRHQGAMISLFDRMVEDEMWDYHNATATNVMDLISERGWNWYKFCRKALCFKLSGIFDDPIDVVFVPRYVSAFKGEWSKVGGQAVFDAAEARFLFSEKKGPDYTRPIISYKLKNPCQRMVDASPTYRAIADLNTPEAVIDWSLPLF